MNARFVRIALAVACSACASSGDCLSAPCPEPIAIVLSVNAGNSATATATVSVQVTTPSGASVTCGSDCNVGGLAGTYNVVASATGYQTVQRSVTVTGDAAAKTCGCPSVTTQNVSIALVPTV